MRGRKAVVRRGGLEGTRVCLSAASLRDTDEHGAIVRKMLLSQEHDISPDSVTSTEGEG